MRKSTIIRFLMFNFGAMLLSCIVTCAICFFFEKNFLLVIKSASLGCLVFFIPFLVQFFYSFRTNSELLTTSNIMYNVFYGLILKYFLLIFIFIFIYKFFIVYPLAMICAFVLTTILNSFLNLYL